MSKITRPPKFLWVLLILLAIGLGLILWSFIGPAYAASPTAQSIALQGYTGTISGCIT